MLHPATCLATLRKGEDSSTFLATCNATSCCIASCENGVLHGQLFSQLAMQPLLRCNLQETFPRVTWPFAQAGERECVREWPGTSRRHVREARIEKNVAPPPPPAAIRFSQFSRTIAYIRSALKSDEMRYYLLSRRSSRLILSSQSNECGQHNN